MSALTELSSFFSSPAVVLFVPVFLGFVSALLVQYLWEWYRSRKIAASLVLDLEKELDKNLRILQAPPRSADDITMAPYETSIWDSAVHTGRLSSLGHSPILPKLTGFYHNLSVLRDWERMKAQSVLLGSVNPDRLRQISENLETLRAYIAKGAEKTLAALRQSIRAGPKRGAPPGGASSSGI